MYTEKQIKANTLKLRQRLKKFPELWAVQQRWHHSDYKHIKVCHAPAIRFLKRGLKPSASEGMESIYAFIVSSVPEQVYDVTLTELGNRITAIGPFEIGDPEGQGLRHLLEHELVLTSKAVRYVFLVETNGCGAQNITVVLPPKGSTGFQEYIKKLKKLRKARSE